MCVSAAALHESAEASECEHASRKQHWIIHCSYSTSDSSENPLPSLTGTGNAKKALRSHPSVGSAFPRFPELRMHRTFARSTTLNTSPVNDVVLKSYLQLLQLSRAHTLLLTGGGNRWSGWDHEKIPVSDSETFICQHRGGSNQSAFGSKAGTLSQVRIPVPFDEYGPACMRCMKSVKGLLQQPLKPFKLTFLPRDQ